MTSFCMWGWVCAFFKSRAMCAYWPPLLFGAFATRLLFIGCQQAHVLARPLREVVSSSCYTCICFYARTHGRPPAAKISPPARALGMALGLPGPVPGRRPFAALTSRPPPAPLSIGAGNSDLTVASAHFLIILPISDREPPANSVDRSCGDASGSAAAVARCPRLTRPWIPRTWCIP